MALLIYSKAFNRAVREDLLSRVIYKGLSVAYAQWRLALLSCRKVNMQIILGRGRQLPLRPGLTQVTFRSALLFLLSIYELRRVVPYNVEVVMFAPIDVSL